MKLKSTIYFSYLYRKRNNRLNVQDIKQFLSLVLLGTLSFLCLFFKNYLIRLDSGLVTLPHSDLSEILSAQQLMIFFTVLEWLFLIMFIFSSLYLLFSSYSYISQEWIFDQKRRTDYLFKFKDKKQIAKEFFIGQFLFLPVGFIFSLLASSLLNHLILGKISSTLMFDSRLFSGDILLSILVEFMLGSILIIELVLRYRRLAND